MKKIIITLFLSLPMLVLADVCHDTYSTGESLFNAGKYAEAQLKFIAVEELCPDYANVYRFLEECNKKLAAEISALKGKNAKLNAQIKEANTTSKPGTSSSSTLRDSAGQAVEKQKGVEGELAQTKEQLESANKTVKQLRSELESVKAEKSNVQSENSSKQSQINELQTENTRLNEELQKAQAEINRLTPKSEDPIIEKDIVTLQKELKELKAQRKLLRGKIKDKKRQIRAAKKQMKK